MGGANVNRILTVALTAPLFATPVVAAPSDIATDAVVMASTPSGSPGDPKTIVCRAPQKIAGSDQSGPQVCLSNRGWSKMAMEGNDLAPDGKTLIDRPTERNPNGGGDPVAITCRTRRVVSHRTDWVKQYSPVLCRPNSFWADVVKNHQWVDLNGKVMSRQMNTDDGPLYGPGQIQPGNPTR